MDLLSAFQLKDFLELVIGVLTVYFMLRERIVKMELNFLAHKKELESLIQGAIKERQVEYGSLERKAVDEVHRLSVSVDKLNEKSSRIGSEVLELTKALAILEERLKLKDSK